jgi:hypothetical protein
MFLRRKKTAGRSGSFGERAATVWTNHYRWVFFLVFLGMCAWGAFFWHQSVYRFQWSPEEKQRYKESRSQRTTLNTKEFDRVLENLARRQSVRESEHAPLKNIFSERR